MGRTGCVAERARCSAEGGVGMGWVMEGGWGGAGVGASGVEIRVGERLSARSHTEGMKAGRHVRSGMGVAVDRGLWYRTRAREEEK